jgi:DNA-binding MarR family transcriptional regulator
VVDGYDRLLHRLVSGHAAEFTEVAITMAQAKLVYVVMAAGSLHLSELAARLGIGASSASEQVDRLVDSGLLERRDEPTDRRQVVVTATTKANDLFERFRELNQGQLRRLLCHLDSDELAVIARSIEIFGLAIDRGTDSGTNGDAADRQPGDRRP